MPDLKISILLPTLNRPKLMAKCLESLRAQTYQPYEYIMIDQSDGSETKEVFEQFDALGRKKIYIHQKEKSLIQARNRGLEHVGETDLTTFIDDDSELSPDYFEKLVVHFQRDTQKQYAGGMGTHRGAVLSEDLFANLFGLPRPGNGFFDEIGIPTFPYGTPKFSETQFLSGGNALFRTPIIKEFRYDSRLKGYGVGDDVDVSYRISRKYKMFYEPTATYYHPEHSMGKDRAFKHRKECIQNFYYLMEKNVGSSPKLKLKFMRYFTGQLLEDIFKVRKGAVLGGIVGLVNVVRGKSDSIS